MSKILFFYTSHRQLKEIAYTAAFINHHNELLADCDFLFHCNNKYMNVPAFINNVNLVENNANFILTSKNCGKTYGAVEAIYDSWQLFEGYDYVIHLHPDVYLVNPKPIFKVLKNEPGYDVYTSMLDDGKYCFDFFILNPRERWGHCAHRIFDQRMKVALDREPTTPEAFLCDMIHFFQPAHNLMSRYKPGQKKDLRGIDLLGLWHEHDLSKVEQYLRDHNIPFDETVQASPEFDKTGMAAFKV